MVAWLILRNWLPSSSTETKAEMRSVVCALIDAYICGIFEHVITTKAVDGRESTLCLHTVFALHPASHRDRCSTKLYPALRAPASLASLCAGQSDHIVAWRAFECTQELYSQVWFDHIQTST